MNDPLGAGPSVWSNCVTADVLLESIRSMKTGCRDERQAVRKATNELNKMSLSLDSRCLLVLDAGYCIATPGEALTMFGRKFAQRARTANGYCLEDEAYIRTLLIEKLTILTDKGSNADLGRLINDYSSLLSWEKEKANTALQPA